MDSQTKYAQRTDNIDHRNKFNLIAFGTTFEDGAIAPKTTKKIPTKEKYEELIRRAKYWNDSNGHNDPVTGAHVTQSAFRKSCGPNWYKEANSYRLVTLRTADGSVVEHLQHHVKKTDSWKIVAHQEMVFDLIHEVHCAVGHRRKAATRNEAAKKYYNLTDELCQLFVNTCPTCNCNYRDQFTACLVDFSSKPTINEYGLKMRWLLVLQEYKTKFTLLRPMCKRTGAALANELSYMFATLGFPTKRFVTEEGTNLKSRVVKDLIRKVEPNCEHEIGEVSQLVEIVKRAIAELENQEIELGNQEPNWVTLVPTAMSAMNKSLHSQVVACVQNTLQDSSQPDAIHETVADSGSNTPIGIQETVANSGSKNNAEEEPPSEVVLPSQIQESEVNTGAPTTTAYAKAATTANGINEDCDKTPLIRHGMLSINVREALLDVSQSETSTIEGKEYRVTFPQLLCEQCDESTGCIPRRLMVADDTFYDCFVEDRWWQANMIATFGILKSHEVHDPKVIFVDAGTPIPMKESWEKQKPLQLPASVTTILTVGMISKHSVALQLKLDDRVAVVYDAYRGDKDRWLEHIDYVLGRYGISRENDQMKWFIRLWNNNDLPHTVRIEQDDDHDCGPIACMVVWKLFDSEAGAPKLSLNDVPSARMLRPSNDVSDWRKLCLMELRDMMKRHQAEIFVIKRSRNRDFGSSGCDEVATNKSVWDGLEERCMEEEQDVGKGKNKDKADTEASDQERPAVKSTKKRAASARPRCNCKKGCNHNCSCRRAKMACSLSCKCMGACANDGTIMDDDNKMTTV